ncbi:MAG: hypothetical protein PUB03_03575 [bacterium]|nr:hypothetical protein [bacterium]
MKEVINKLSDTKISTSYLFILLGVCALMMTGYFSYAWFTVQGVQQYSVVTGNLRGSIAIGANSVAIEGTGTISYTPSTDSETVTITVTNSSDRTVKNSIYYYTLSDSSIGIGYTSDSPTIPTIEGVSVEKGKTLTYKIKVKGANGKAVKIGSSMGLVNSNLTLPSGTVAFELLSEPSGAETLIAKANPESLDYNSATDDQKNQMWTFTHEATTQLGATTDYRYIGANPNNYVKFNDELWRIIGVFDVDDGKGKLEKRLKIIRNESIGNYSWDNKNTSTGAETAYGKNNWPDARLNYLLNEGHDSETYGGSLYWNRKSGTCYSGLNNATTSCDFTSTGLTDSAKEMIGDAKWYLGGTASYTSSTNGLASHFYKYERGTTVYSGRSTKWTGKVGLIYPSDYGYATSGNSSTSRATCLAKEMYNWDGVRACYQNDWLFKSSYMWTLSPRSSNSNYVFYVYSGGYVADNGADSVYSGAWPVVHLKSTIKVTTGTGSSNDPFILE